MRAVRCNLLEDDDNITGGPSDGWGAGASGMAFEQAPLQFMVDAAKGQVLIDFTPFQVISIKLYF